jgi:DNA adenine methylase
MMERGIIPAINAPFEHVLGKVAGAPTLPHSVRSPLRYPGGKSRAVETLIGYIPYGTETLVSPFLGGGSLELACAANGMTVYAADAFLPLINFWQHAKDMPVMLAERVQAYYPLKRNRFYTLQKRIVDMENNLERAAIFYVLNRSSFSGVTLSGGMSPEHKRFTKSAIERLRNFRAPNLHVTCADFADTLAKYPSDFVYLDPPYANGERLYGTQGDMHDGFDHEGLADLLRERTGWMLSYNDHPDIRKMYDGFDFQTPEWKWGMSNGKESNELLILNV